jgi:hypothetical protein
MKIEIDDDYADKLVKEILEYNVGVYEKMLAGDGLYYPVKYPDKSKDLKYIEELVSAYKLVLEDYQYV